MDDACHFIMKQTMLNTTRTYVHVLIGKNKLNSRFFSNTITGSRKNHEKQYTQHSSKRYKNIQTSVRTMSNVSFVSTSARGLTNEISIPVPWGKIAAKTWGVESNPPVLCVHGWLDNSNSFDTLIPLLPEDKFYVCIDLPGNGLSSFIPPGMFYTMYDHVALVHRVVKYFKWEVFTYIGHSLGGNIGGAFSATFPTLVDKLVFIDAPGFFPFPASDTCNRLKSSIEGYYDYEQKESNAKTFNYQQAKDRLKAANKALSDEGIDILLERGSQQVEDGSFVFRRDYRHHLSNPVVVTKEVANVFFNSIEAEVLHVVADKGLMAKHRGQAEKLLGGSLTEILSKAHYHEIFEVEGKHHVHLCNPDRLSAALTKFLNRPMRPMDEKR